MFSDGTYAEKHTIMFRTGLSALALIYQTCVETGADPGANNTLRQVSSGIYQTVVSRRSQRTPVLINAAAENNRNLNITPLYFLSLEASPRGFTTWICALRHRRGTSLKQKLTK